MIQNALAFFRLLRIANLFIIALSLSLFYYFILVPVHKNILHTTLVPFTNFDFALFVLSVVMVAAGGNIINDYYDFDLDREFKPTRPLVSGRISLNVALYIHAVLMIGGILLGYYLSWDSGNFQIGYLYVFCALLLFAYSSFVKKIPLAGNIIVAGLTAFVFVLLMVFETNFLNLINFDDASYALAVLLWQLKFYGGFAFLTSLAREIVKTLEDMDGDRQYDVNTIAVQFGPVVAKVATGLVLLSLLSGLLYFMIVFFQAKAINEMAYLGIALLVPVLIAFGWLTMAKERKDFARLSLLLKIIMLLGIFSIPFFYYFKGR